MDSGGESLSAGSPSGGSSDTDPVDPVVGGDFGIAMLEAQLFCVDRLDLFESPPALFDLNDLVPGPNDGIVHRPSGICLGSSKLLVRRQGKPSSPSSVLAYTRTLFKRSLGKLSKILEGVCRPYVFLRFLQALVILRFTWEVLCESRHLDPNRTALCCCMAVGCGTSCRLSWTDGLRWVRSTSGTATALCRTCCCTHIGPTELTSH